MNSPEPIPARSPHDGDGDREIRGYDAVRTAARDYTTYSSRLLGDRDVHRAYYQLPLEVDPPDHALYRQALQPFFVAAAIDPHTADFAALARRLIDAITRAGRGEIVYGLALPYVMGCLAYIFRRPQDHDEWVSWGADVWLAEAYQQGLDLTEARRVTRERDFDCPNVRSGDVLEAYLDRVLGEAEQRRRAGAPVVDIWDHVLCLDIDGRALEREEMLGIGSLLMAAGREPVMKLITGLVWHLAQAPEDRQWLRDHPADRPRAIAEMLRYFSPLPKMERLTTDANGHEHLVLLNFASGNHDPQRWDDPASIDIHRPRQPHLAFGFGRHSCLGMSITDRETSAFLDVLLHEWPGWRLEPDADIEWVTEPGAAGPTVLLDRFERVEVSVETVGSPS